MGRQVRHRSTWIAGLCALATAGAAPAAARAQVPAAPPRVPTFTHVVEVMLENESAPSTFEDATGAPDLARLRSRALYLPQFYGAGHASLDNYEAAFGAVQPTPQGESDCLGQPFASCIFPASVPTLGALLDAHGRSWKVYSEGMAGAPGGGNCLHAPNRNAPDPYQGPGTNGDATRHNPAPWFASVLDKGGSESYCQAHSVDLSALWKDAASAGTLPSWSFVEPDTCHDGHDTAATGGCAGDPEGLGAPSGVAAINSWLPGFVARLTGSPAWDAGSLLVITFDEGSENSGCGPCHDGSGGGRIGALLIGTLLAHPGSTSQWAGDHYSLLRTWETAWGLPTLKSQAADAAAAASVHDGDPGVTPLTGIWNLPGGVLAACHPDPLRVRLRHHQIVAAAAYLGGRLVASARGKHVRALLLRHPPSRSFSLRIVLTKPNHSHSHLTVRVRLKRTASGCKLVPASG